jgi:tetratricopeptide (TPR) repeat protein
MANRNERSGAATVPPTQRSRPGRVTRASGTTAQARARGGSRTFGANLPIDVHRLIAAIALAGLLLVTLLTPLSYSAPGAAGFITPQIDGSGSAGPGFTSRGVESSIFPYISFIERQQGNLASTWPGIDTVLDAEPNSREARRAIVGQLFSSTSRIDARVKDSGLATRPDQEVFDGIVITYQDMADDPNRQYRGINGLAMISALVSLTAPTLEERRAREREAVVGFQNAASGDTNTWQYSYNWALSNFLIGNYTAAYEGMKSVRARSETDEVKLVDFWMGLSALRAGRPDEAVTLFQSVIDYELPVDATEAARNWQTEARDLSQKALGDAQWARRDPATAYETYKNTLFFGRSSPGLYRKWLRLGLQQHSYERMVDDLAAVTRSGLPEDIRTRAHHDRGRLLDLLGRGGEAQAEYARAIELGADDASLHVSYGQSLASRGDYNGAVVQAETALLGASRDLQGSDLALTARSVLTTTTSTEQDVIGQVALDAHLLRARAWAAQGNRQNVDTLVNNITGPAAAEGADAAALLYMYGAFAYESAASASSGDAAGEFYGKAAALYARAWEDMKGRMPGAPGRAAALAGQARTTALSAGKGPEDGIAVLREAGYDPAAIPTPISRDPDAPDVLYQGGLLLEQAGRQEEAVNAYRVSGVVRNLVDAEDFAGVGRVLWSNNGTTTPANAALETGDAARVEAAGGGGDPGLAVMRYKQAYSLDPALAPAWNNLGVWYAEQGKPDVSASYLELSGRASPYYALGNHNLAGLAYKKGIGNFFVAEGAQGNAIKAAGAPSLNWGYNLRYDARGAVPAPPGPPLDFLVRLGAIALVALLLLHTLVGHDRLSKGGELLPMRGVLGRAAASVDGAVKRTVPAAVTPGTSTRSLLIAVVVPAIIGTFGLAWGAGRGSFEVALVFVPVALLWALLAFAANEVAQRWMAARSKGATLHHLWPLGNVLSILAIPFGFMYGWQNVTRLQPVTEAGAATSRRGRTSDESELAYEAVVEAAADVGGTSERSLPAAGSPVKGAGRLGLTPASRIMFAGMVANLALGVLFGLVYWLTGWPSMRLGLFATMLVLAFTSVSEPPADGWTLYRRNAPLWLAVFVLSSTVAVLLALSAI